MAVAARDLTRQPTEDRLPAMLRTYPPRTLTAEQIVEKLRQRPYDRTCREATDLLEGPLAQ